MFRLNRGRRVSAWTVARLLAKSIFVKSSGQPRWKSIFGFAALGFLAVAGFVLMSPQQTPATVTTSSVNLAPTPVATATAVPTAPKHLIVRFKRSFSNDAYRTLDRVEDGIEGTQTTTTTMSIADFRQGLEANGLTDDEQSLERILYSNCTKGFVLTAGVDDFEIVYHEMNKTDSFLAALKANPLVVDAWLS